MKHDIDQLRAQLVQLESDEPLRIKTVKQLELQSKAWAAKELSELEEFRERQEALERQKQKQEAQEKERQRQKRIIDKFAQRLEEHLNSMQGTVDTVVKNWKDGEALRQELAEVDFNIEPAFMHDFRPEYHAQQCVGFSIAVGLKRLSMSGNVINRLHYLESKDEDFLTAPTYSTASPDAPLGLEIITEPEE